MIEYLPFILQAIALFVSLLWVSRDISSREIEKKFYWIWSVALIVGVLFLGFLGLGLSFLGYYVWSRLLRES